MTPRILLALGLSLFRSTRKLLRQLAIEQALAKANGSETTDDADVQRVSEKLSEADPMHADSESRLAEIGRSLIESEELDEAVFEESDELTPDEIANRLESLLIGIARTYLVSKELTYLLNSTIRFDYKSHSRDLVIRKGKLAIGTPSASEDTQEACEVVPSDPHNPFNQRTCHWSDLNVCDYDRMRVLLTEVTRMKTTNMKVEILPPLSILSRW